MYFGEYRHSLDAKCRLRLPAKLKSTPAVYVVTKGNDGCLFVFDKDYFDNEFIKKLEHIPTFDALGQQPLRAFMSSCYEVEEDAQGRILLPQQLKTFAQIDKDVVIIGVGNRREIWAEKVWDNYNDPNNFDAMLSKLAQYDV